MASTFPINKDYSGYLIINKHGENIFSIYAGGKRIFSIDRDLSIFNNAVTFISNEFNYSTDIQKVAINDEVTDNIFDYENNFGIVPVDEDPAVHSETLKPKYLNTKLHEIGYFKRAGTTVIVNTGEGTGLSEIEKDLNSLKIEYRSDNLKYSADVKLLPRVLFKGNALMSDYNLIKKDIELSINSNKNLWLNYNPVIYIERYKGNRKVAIRVADNGQNDGKLQLKYKASFVREKLNNANPFGRVNKFENIIQNQIIDIKPETYFWFRLPDDQLQIKKVKAWSNKWSSKKQAKQIMRFCLELSIEAKLFKIYSKPFEIVQQFHEDGSDFYFGLKYL